MKKIKILSFLISYLNIFYASETEQDARKTIIKKLKVFFTDKKYYSNNKNFFQIIATFNKYFILSKNYTILYVYI